MADKKDQRFTFDSEKEGQEVPTLTSLLYKKNLVKSEPSDRAKTSGSPGRAAPAAKPYQSTMMTLEPTITTERPLPDAEPATSISMPTPGTGSAGIVRSDFASQAGAARALGALKGEVQARRTQPAATPYTSAPISKPMGAAAYPATAFAASGLRFMIQKPKVSAAIVFESATPDVLRMKSIVQAPGTSSRTQLWNGMEFSTQDFSDLWGRLGKFGYAEFSTLGSAGNGNYDRIAFRNAFQAKGNEWVTFVRVKDATGKEGLVVFVSETSIQSLLPSFHSEILGSAKGPAAVAA